MPAHPTPTAPAAPNLAKISPTFQAMPVPPRRRRQAVTSQANTARRQPRPAHVGPSRRSESAQPQSRRQAGAQQTNTDRLDNPHLVHARSRPSDKPIHNPTVRATSTSRFVSLRVSARRPDKPHRTRSVRSPDYAAPTNPSPNLSTRQSDTTNLASPGRPRTRSVRHV